ELARLYGYNNIPIGEHSKITLYPTMKGKERFIENLKNILVALDFTEVYNNSLTSISDAEIFEPKDRIVRVENPISIDMSCLRPSLLTGLLGTVRYNENRNIFSLKIFEIGTVFIRSEGTPTGVKEADRVAGVITGNRTEKLWNQKVEQFDFFDLKGSLESLFERIHLDNIEYSAGAMDYLNPCVFIKCGGAKIGIFGSVSRTILERYDIKRPVYFFDLDISPLSRYISEEIKYVPVIPYPSVERDLSIIVDEEVAASSILKGVYEAGGEYLKHVSFYDVYKGKQIEEGKKSITLHLSFQSLKRTLTDVEVDSLFEKIVKSLEKSIGSKLRPK
ncbi:MAG: hypothetical protein ACE5QV_09540, partial [Fidelibacterota bacterium]